MIRLSFGPNGEFFIESSEALSADSVEMAEALYRRIMNARSECDILHEAGEAMNRNEDEDEDCDDCAEAEVDCADDGVDAEPGDCPIET